VTSQEPTDLATVLASLTDFSHRCVPGKFTELLSSSEVLNSIATMIIRLEDDDEQETAAHAFNRARMHLDSIVRRSYLMYLLEDEAGDQTKAAQLARALAIPAERANFLFALARLSEAAVCGDALRRNRDARFLWHYMLTVATNFPAMAGFAPPIDPDALMSKVASGAEAVYKRAEGRGLRLIDLDNPLAVLEEHAGALWLKLLQDGPDKAAIEQIRKLLRRALHFLQSPPGERWILQPYKSILPTDSLRGILDELLNYDLEPLSRDDLTTIFMEKSSPLTPAFPPVGPFAVFGCLLTEGRFRKRKYAILFPDPQFLVNERVEEPTAQPLQFIKDHLDDIPTSIGTKRVERHLARIEALQNEENLEPWLKTLAVGMTANAISLALCHSLQLPSEARAFITTFVNSLVLLVRRDRQ
jgi:hypothetical protein